MENILIINNPNTISISGDTSSIISKRETINFTRINNNFNLYSSGRLNYSFDFTYQNIYIDNVIQTPDYFIQNFTLLFETNNVSNEVYSSIGSPNDSVASGDTVSGSVISFIKRGMTYWNSLLQRIPTLIGGRIPIDVQSLPLPTSGATSQNQVITNNILSTIMVDGEATNVKLDSINTNILSGNSKLDLYSTDWYFRVAHNEVPKYSTFSRFGMNSSVPTTGGDLCTWTNNYVFLTVAENLRVVSSSVSDTLLGVGARKVYITGLDSNWDIINETVNLNGVTPVFTTQQFLRVNRTILLESNNSVDAVGNITVSNNAGTNTLAQINAGDNVAQFAIYSSPRNYLTSLIRVGVSNSTNDTTQVRLQVRANADLPNTSFVTYNRFMPYQATAEIDFKGLINIPQKSDVKFRGYSATATDVVSCSFTLVSEDYN